MQQQGDGRFEVGFGGEKTKQNNHTSKGVQEHFLVLCTLNVLNSEAELEPRTQSCM
jgi:hypothetical protein